MILEDSFLEFFKIINAIALTNQTTKQKSPVIYRLGFFIYGIFKYLCVCSDTFHLGFAIT